MSSPSFRLLATLALVLTLALPVFAKPAPPTGLMKIFSTFIHGEEFVEEDDWAGMDKWLTDIEKGYQGLRPQIAAAVSPAELTNFEKALVAMRGNITTRQHDRAHSDFIALHKSFIHLLDEFDYKVPPIMFLVQNDLLEVVVGLKEGEMDEVGDELKEVELFYNQAIPELKARALPEAMIAEFRAQLVRCIGAYTANDRKLLNTELAKLQQLFAAQTRTLGGN